MQFGLLNWTIVCIYFVAMFVVGIVITRRQKTAEDFILAGRRMPWFIVAMSIFSSLTSALSYMGIPALAYRENISLIMLGVASLIVAPLLAVTFYPIYRRLNVTTSYEYIYHRYGQSARYAVSILFVLARLGWLGTVLYAPAFALNAISGVDIRWSIPVIGLLATGYTVLGGLAAVMIIDVIQFIILVGGAVAVAITLIIGVDGGLSEIIRVSHESGHLHVFGTSLSFFEMSGAIVLIAYLFQLAQEYGTDQMTVQRLLTTPNLKSMMRAVVGNSFIDLIVIGLLLFNGLGIFVYYQQNPGALGADATGDQILPYYIIHALPAGLAGLLITSIFVAAMGAMDSGINVVATVITNDLIKPQRQQKTSNDANDVRLVRFLTVVLGLFSIGVALFASTIGSLIKASQTFLGIFLGPILALFILGIFTRRGNFFGWLIGVTVAIPFTIFLQRKEWMIDGMEKTVHFVYYFPAAFLVTLVIGYAGSYLRPAPLAEPHLTIWGRRADSTK